MLAVWLAERLECERRTKMGRPRLRARALALAVLAASLAMAAAERCCVPPGRGMLKLRPSRDQIAKASSSNATTTRRFTGSSTANS
jgi:hypothetical protein